MPNHNLGVNPNSNPNPNQITVIYVVELPNVFRKLIATFRRVPWIILLKYLTE